MADEQGQTPPPIERIPMKDMRSAFDNWVGKAGRWWVLLVLAIGVLIYIVFLVNGPDDATVGLPDLLYGIGLFLIFSGVAFGGIEFLNEICSRQMLLMSEKGKDTDTVATRGVATRGLENDVRLTNISFSAVMDAVRTLPFVRLLLVSGIVVILAGVGFDPKYEFPNITISTGSTEEGGAGSGDTAPDESSSPPATGEDATSTPQG